jgi:glucosamine--fructose-6-phosphate aminotransferase (isomerizing)
VCGIVGYVGRSAAIDIVIDGLRRLEYRGYDSAGVALMDDTRLLVHRTLGRVHALVIEGEASRTARVGIGHTRWATHGPPSVVNAHPHVDCTESVAVVHNGIVENHAALRSALIGRGHRFRSDTDTEVIAHLLEEHSGGDLATTVRKVVDLLHGDFALAILSAHVPGRLAAVRVGTPPLLVAAGAGEYLVASDLLPLAGRASTVRPLENGEVVVAAADGLEARERAPMVAVTWTPDQAELHGHPHFMHKEIHEQPEAVRRTLAAVGGRDSRAQTRRHVAWSAARHVSIIACGSSFHAGLAARRYFESLARIRVDVEVASEFRHRQPLLGSQDVCVLISQSGETADTLGALQVATSSGATTIAVCNVPGASITREADRVVMTDTGPEIGVASTKAFTAQLVALLVLALEAAAGRATIPPETADTVLAAIAELPAHLARVIAREGDVAAVAAACRRYRDFFFLGRGPGLAIALEGALKLKEIAYVRAEAFPAGEMKHGPLALVHEDAVAVVLAPRDITHTRMLATMEEIRARGGRILALCTENDADVTALANWTLPVPVVDELLLPCVLVPPLQLLAYHMAVLAGHDVDRPRNLAKSVTVE